MFLQKDTRRTTENQMARQGPNCLQKEESACMSLHHLTHLPMVKAEPPQ